MDNQEFLGFHFSYVREYVGFPPKAACRSNSDWNQSNFEPNQSIAAPNFQACGLGAIHYVLQIQADWQMHKQQPLKIALAWQLATSHAAVDKVLCFLVDTVRSLRISVFWPLA